MLTDSLNAIRTFLKNNFPSVKTIYVNEVPEGFERPSFFIDLINGTNEPLSKKIFNNKFTWQIVYFTKLSSSGISDTLTSFTMIDQIQKALDEVVCLGEFYIDSFNVSSNKELVFITISLETQHSRTEKTYEIIKDINIEEE